MKFIAKSRLETYAWEKLTEAGIVFEYEPYSVVLLPAFVSNSIFVEKGASKFKIAPSSVRAITYKPDFVGTDWVMETKGFRRDSFDLRWKMFKKHLLDKGKWLLLLPSNQKEVDECITLIKQWSGGDKEILQISPDFELVPVRRAAPKTPKGEKRQPRAPRGHSRLKKR